jgi:hypothetical protein
MLLCPANNALFRTQLALPRHHVLLLPTTGTLFSIDNLPDVLGTKDGGKQRLVIVPAGRGEIGLESVKQLVDWFDSGLSSAMVFDIDNVSQKFLSRREPKFRFCVLRNKKYIQARLLEEKAIGINRENSDAMVRGESFEQHWSTAHSPIRGRPPLAARNRYTRSSDMYL